MRGRAAVVFPAPIRDEHGEGYGDGDGSCIPIEWLVSCCGVEECQLSGRVEADPE